VWIRIAWLQWSNYTLAHLGQRPSTFKERKRSTHLVLTEPHSPVGRYILGRYDLEVRGGTVVNPTPEPGSVLLFCSGLVALAFMWFRRNGSTKSASAPTKVRGNRRCHPSLAGCTSRVKLYMP
jgi:hypothetical protein